MRQNMATPSSVRKQPETFCCTLIIRRSLSAWLLSKGKAKSWRNRSTAHFPEDESIQQIASRALFGSPWFSLPLFRLPRCRGRGVGLVPFCQDLIIAMKQACERQDIQFVLAQRFGSLDLGFHIQEQVFHLACAIRCLSSSSTKVSSRR